MEAAAALPRGREARPPAPDWPPETGDCLPWAASSWKRLQAAGSCALSAGPAGPASSPGQLPGLIRTPGACGESGDYLHQTLRESTQSRGPAGLHSFLLPFLHSAHVHWEPASRSVQKIHRHTADNRDPRRTSSLKVSRPPFLLVTIETGLKARAPFM